MRISVGDVSVELVGSGDRVVAHEARGGFERRTLAVWAGILATRRGAIVDVGAYTGLFSIAAALYGAEEIVALEPFPRNAGRLIRNASVNGVRGKIRLIEAAASDRLGHAQLFYNPAVILTSGASLVSGKGDAIEVESVPLDWLKIQNVAAIKIDAERAEPLVLAGARETIEAWRPAIVVEVLDQEIGRQVLEQLPDYDVVEEMDGRNWLLLPC